MSKKKARKVKAKPRPAARKATKPSRPRIVKRRMRGGDATPKPATPPAQRRPAALSAASPPSTSAGGQGSTGGAQGGLARLQRMMAASADNDAGLEVKARSPDMPGVPRAEAAEVRKPSAGNHHPGPATSGAAPSHSSHSHPAAHAPAKGKTVVLADEGDGEGDGEDAGFVVAGGKAAQKVEKGADGVAVVSKGPAKFSMEDMEALRKAIVIKGSGLVVAGINLDELKYDEEGLIAVVAQDRATGAVLMQAWANKDALKQSLTTNEMTYFSRTRNKLWTKGEESGHTQTLVQLKVDCDKDSLLAVVEQTGVACHRETGTCFFDDRAIPVAGFLGELDRLVADRAKERPEGSYTTKLLEDPSLAAGKVVEEAKEVQQVLKGKPNPDTLQHEAADLLFHLLVACRGKGVGLREIVAELLARHGDGKDTKGKA